MAYLRLSYNLSVDSPVPSGLPAFTLEQFSNIEQGDASNLFMLHLCNHTGTHIDAPGHFLADGLRIADFEVSEFVFSRPFCLDLSLKDGELVQSTHLRAREKKIEGSDLLLVRTGYSVFRHTEPDRYRLRSPGFSAEGARYLVQQFPRLRGLGLDTISLCCAAHIEEGMEAHRILLSGRGRRFLIIEDLNLDFDPSNLRQVIALPLFVEGIDGSLCTVLGVTD